ncbi:MAG: Mur ligase family protein, partial [Candidatus Saccharimonas sp.]
MKSFLKGLVVSTLNRQVRRLYKKHQFKTIAVVGSIGKTSTKFAVASVLSQGMRVRYQAGNYNDIVSVPLIYFGHELPALTNIVAWLKVFRSNQKQIRGPYPFDAVVVELGTDFPGNIVQFKDYMKADIAVVTAITPEHMENFADLDAVAKEELTIVDFSTTVLYSTDFIKDEHKKLLPEGAISYGIKNPSDYHLANIYHSAGGLEGVVKHGDEIYLHFGHEVVSQMQLYSMLAAVVVGNKLDMKRPDITAGIANIHPVSGRLRRLRGINNSIIIDDSYNASPEAVKAALESLYDLVTPQRIA